MSRTNAIVYVEGGDVQGARADSGDISIEVFNVDDKKAEGKSMDEINEEWAEIYKHYGIPII